MLDIARGYSGEGGEFSGDKLVGAVAKGGMQFAFGTVKGIINLVGHPLQTAKGIGHAVTHPKELLNGLKEHYWGSRKNWAEKVLGVTEAICDVAFLAYGAKKGFDELSKGAKTGEAAAKAGEVGEIAEEAAKAGEVAEEAAKAGEVAEDAAKAGEKAGGKVKIESAVESGSNTGTWDMTEGGGVINGRVPKHKTPSKRAGTGQAWFPKNWSDSKIKEAGNFIANLPENKNLPNGVKGYGEYDGVRVGIIKTDGKVGTIFPDANLQP